MGWNSPRRVDLGARFDEIARDLDHFELRALDPEEEALADESLRGEPGDAGRERFLGYYSRRGIETALARYGLMQRLEGMGFRDVRVSLDVEDPFQQRVRLHHDGGSDPRHLLAELVAREARFVARDADSCDVPWEGAGKVFRLVVVDWLTLRDPRASFSRERPRLPGQEHPGLGLGAETLELLLQMAKRLDLDGVLNFPDHYHNAVLYSPRFRYFDPVLEGRLRAIRRAAGDAGLARASHAIERGHLRDGNTGEVVAWSAMRGEMILPASRLLASRFETAAYEACAKRAEADSSYRFDWADLDAGLIAWGESEDADAEEGAEAAAKAGAHADLDARIR